VDVGSLTAKAVVLAASPARVLGEALVVGTTNPEAAGREALQSALRSAGVSETEVSAAVGTGYGRARLSFATRRITEITCHARGVHHLLPAARTVVDVGGQDSKAIRLDEAGRVLDFEMNDRCAAGTGRFLEVMASALGVDLGGLIELARQASAPVRVSSTCTVFAESEVVGLLAHGTAPADVTAGVCAAVAQRIAALVWRLGLDPPLAFTGGVALNEPVAEALAQVLEMPLLRPASPRMTGALGAALLAAEGGGSFCV
jgi:predicted CoA-substrate-specific enzyme activase